MTARTMDVRDPYVTEFERAVRSLPGAAAFRRRGLERFRERGFPEPTAEAWRFTDLTPLLETSFRAASGTANPAQFAGLARGPLRGCQIAFVDGRYAPAFSLLELPPGVRVSSLAAVLRDDPRRVEPWLGSLVGPDGEAFPALNAAFFSDGVFLFLPRGVEFPRPIHILFLSSLHGEAYMTHPRVLVVAEENARASIVESHLGPAGGTYLSNSVVEIVLGADAALDYTKVQRESHDAFHVQAMRARLERGAQFVHRSISLGARLARNDFEIVLDGEGSEVDLLGLYEVAGRQLADHHTSIDHVRPHAVSRELYKGILDGRSRGVFDGRIVVRPGAQKTSALQTNKNLLLSREALVHTKPQLEIFANDVKCKHGATIGQLDEDVLFYLRSRGIALAEARRLLVHAFASEIIDSIRDEAVRAQVGGCYGILRAPAPPEGAA
ncbi:MAG TPA: Fe-S cluster assembly protein SufD [Planctomycetota bacterium]|nr:Fe-S cluster assembly protein SufD [Planctomycetota bacterium]